MRVLHVIPSIAERSGGPATAIIPMCRALMQQGIEVLLVSTDAGLKDKSVAEYKGVPAMLFPAEFGESFKYSRPLASWLTTNIRQFDLAHVHAVFNHSSVAAARACQRTGVPYLIRPLGTLDPWSMTQKPLRKRLFWQVAGKRMLQRAAAVHYTSEAEKLSTERLTGLNHGRVVPLGIENPSATTRETLARHFPDLARYPYVLVLSRLHPKKGLGVLVDAFLSLAKTPGWRLVLAGDGPPDYVSKLKNKASQCNQIVFTGWIDGEQKDALLGCASLLALPSHQENFGLSVMEAMSHSVPVLVSPGVNLAPEIVKANAGWIAAIDQESLTIKLAEALSDEAERAKRGRGGKQLSLRYSWENAAKSLVQLYQQVLAENGRADVHRV
ncbi:MAG TPA: glycosyltransferase [Pyrinomonadaceae bacterium]|jgi:glycosyltransferase involved in cell wall biosynthesis|nr:glycosyltransferase [Pyrinomonadaceae bacterium]